MKIIIIKIKLQYSKVSLILYIEQKLVYKKTNKKKLKLSKIKTIVEGLKSTLKMILLKNSD